MKKILVIGSLNMDSVIKTEQMPKPGETVMGDEVTYVPGGKGANQAYAAGKLGGNVAMIGAVGNDSFGDIMIDNLKKVGVDINGIKRVDGIGTGQAYIMVDGNGQNSIVVIPGANQCVTKDLIDENIEMIQNSDIVVMQLEIPVETVLYVKELCVKFGKQIIFDPAPAVSDLPDEFWSGIDYIKPNETELEILTGIAADLEENIAGSAETLLKKGVKNVIVSLGEKGCFYMSEQVRRMIPTQKIEAVDTTAAGDSFTAAFALALSRGEKVDEAIRLGQKVSGIVVSRKGAQTSIPSREEIEEKPGKTPDV